MVLESLVRTPRVIPGGWRIDHPPDTGGGHSVLDLLPLLEALLEVDTPTRGAELFHGTLVAALVGWLVPAAAALGTGTVVLGGGCLINRVLAEGLVTGLSAHGLTAWLAREAPSNDGGLALGQAWVAVERLTETGG